MRQYVPRMRPGVALERRVDLDVERERVRARELELVPERDVQIALVAEPEACLGLELRDQVVPQRGVGLSTRRSRR